MNLLHPKLDIRGVKLVLAALPILLVAVLIVDGERGASRSEPSQSPDSISPAGDIPETIGEWGLDFIEWFPEDLMYKKINGRAQFYQNYGVAGLVSATASRDGESWDIYIYRMNTPKAARAAFMAETPASKEKLDLGQGAYTVPGMLAFYVGQNYIQLNALDPESELAGISEFAASLAEILDSGEGAEESTAKISLPTEFCLSENLDYQPEGAFGFSALKEVDFARYEVAGVPATWFMATGAGTAMDAYTNELKRYGCQEFLELGAGAVSGEIFGSWEAVGLLEGTLFGIHEADSYATVSNHWRTLSSLISGDDNE